MEEDHKPWWQDDPELQEVLRRSFEEFEQELERREPDGPDAVRTARAAGLSWAEIGRVLGASKQLLHRRFRTRSASSQSPRVP